MKSAAPMVSPGTKRGMSATRITPPGLRMRGIARPTAVATIMQTMPTTTPMAMLSYSGSPHLPNAPMSSS